MPISIDEFTTEIAKSGLLKVSSFMVRVYFPEIVINSSTSNSSSDIGDTGLALRIQRVTLPPRQMKTLMQKSAYREFRPMPVGYNSFDDVTMQILLSSDLRERKVFIAWQNKIFNDGGVPAYIDSIGGKLEVYTAVPYTRNEYTTTPSYTDFNTPSPGSHTPSRFDASGGPPNREIVRVTKHQEYTWTCHVFDQCWPMMIGDIELSAEGNEFAMMNVVWQYRSWYLKPQSEIEQKERDMLDGFRNAKRLEDSVVDPLRGKKGASIIGHGVRGTSTGGSVRDQSSDVTMIRQFGVR